jgi:Flp pilus assembly pilin Flp
MFKSFIKNEDGAGLVEYGLIVLLIAAAMVTILTVLSASISESYSSSAAEVREAMGGP